MTYFKLVEEGRAKNCLLSVLLELTYRCNLDCFFCYNDLGLTGKPLQRQDYERLLEELAELQVLELTLSGGEPLASPCFWPVGRKARELGFVLRLKSNGHALGENVAKRIQRELDPYVIEISLHGATAKTHDRQTQVVGSFDRLLSNLQGLRALGLRFRLQTTMTRWNEAEIESMFELAQSLDALLIVDSVVTPRDDGDRTPLSIAPSPAAGNRLRLLQEAQVRTACTLEPVSGKTTTASPDSYTASKTPLFPKKHCGTGATTLTIDPYGNVYPCVQWRRPVGNLHQQTIRQIWFHSPQLPEIRRINEQAHRLVSGMPRKERPRTFCLGLAEELTGDPLALYPQLLDPETA